jgi:hypothetical protein
LKLLHFFETNLLDPVRIGREHTFRVPETERKTAASIALTSFQGELK